MFLFILPYINIEKLFTFILIFSFYEFLYIHSCNVYNSHKRQSKISIYHLLVQTKDLTQIYLRAWSLETESSRFGSFGWNFNSLIALPETIQL